MKILSAISYVIKLHKQTTRNQNIVTFHSSRSKEMTCNDICTINCTWLDIFLQLVCDRCNQLSRSEKWKLTSLLYKDIKTLNLMERALILLVWDFKLVEEWKCKKTLKIHSISGRSLARKCAIIHRRCKIKKIIYKTTMHFSVDAISL